MFKRQAFPGHQDLFVSVKAATPIPTRHPAVRDALVQASLDPQFRSIVYLASANVASEQVDLDAIVLQGEERRFLLDVIPARRVRSLEQEGIALIALSRLGLTPLTLTAEEIRREPRFTNARLVWSYRGASVPVGLRLSILQILLDDGPVPLGVLLKSIRSDRDPAPSVMALACADLLILDLVSQPLGPGTIVRNRS